MAASARLSVAADDKDSFKAHTMENTNGSSIMHSQVVREQSVV